MEYVFQDLSLCIDPCEPGMIITSSTTFYQAKKAINIQSIILSGQLSQLQDTNLFTFFDIGKSCLVYAKNFSPLTFVFYNITGFMYEKWNYELIKIDPAFIHNNNLDSVEVEYFRDDMDRNLLTFVNYNQAGSINCKLNNNKIYSLSGEIVQKPTNRGIYIKNNKIMLNLDSRLH